MWLCWRFRTPCTSPLSSPPRKPATRYSAERIIGSPIVGAFARVETYNRDYTVEDTALVLMRHKNGATTSLQVAWSVTGGGQGVNEVHGTLGSISQTKSDVGPIAYFNN